MADYTSPFTITNTMLDCGASISEKIGKMSALKNLEAKPHLRKNNRIRSIYPSIFRWKCTIEIPTTNSGITAANNFISHKYS